MRNKLFAAIAVGLLAGDLAAQNRIDPARLHPVKHPPRHAGTVDVTTGKWSKPAHAIATQKAGGVQTIFNNTCTWTGGGYFAGFQSCEWNFDEGRIPSTSDPSAPTGAQDQNLMESIDIIYCTYVPTSSLPTGYDMELAFYDKNNGDCVGNIAQQPPPVSVQASAYFDLAGLGLPGSTSSGFQACWIITVDVSNSGWVLASDGEGVFDNDAPNDKFIWAQAQNSANVPQGSSTPDGFFIKGEPATGGFGACSYDIPCGTDAIFGNTCGTGLDAFDGSWINVDGVAVGSSGGALPSCPDSTAQYGYGTNCYFFGGYPANPFASYWLVLRSDRQAGGPAIYCTARTSSCGSVPSIDGPAHTATLTAGSGSYNVTCGLVPDSPTAGPGVLIHTPAGSDPTPAALPFGFLCINSPFFRGPVTGPVSGGPGNCDSTYLWNFGLYLQVNAGMFGFLPGNTCDIQAWYRDPSNAANAPFGAANFSNAMTVLIGVSSTPTVSGFSPSSGGEGTGLTVTGANFGSNPIDLKVLLANGVGFADVDTATSTQLTATAYAVGNTAVGPITVIHGSTRILSNQTSNVAGISSTATQVRMTLQGLGGNSAQSFTLSPASNNTVSATVGNPLPGTISLPMSSLSGGDMSFRLCFKVGSDFRTFQCTIDFTGIPTQAQMAEHLADHLNKSFGPQGISAAVSGTTVRISMAGATYGGIVVKGQ